MREKVSYRWTSHKCSRSTTAYISESSVKNRFSRWQRVWRSEEHGQEESQEYPEPADQAPEVVADGGEDSIVGVAVTTGEVVAVHSMFVLGMADDRFDGGAAA